MSATMGVRMTGAGTACDNDRCSVLVYNPEGPRRIGNPVSGCPSCGKEGFRVRFGVQVDEITTGPAPSGEAAEPTTTERTT